jgi:23S rRNA-/tRNA-specific pseudouridylate synthase
MSDLTSPLSPDQAERSSTPQLITQLEAEGLWIFMKPARWLSHPDGSERPDLISWARGLERAPEGLTLVHRLDYGTSGLLCCASDPAGASRWGERWASGQVAKRYLALAEGKLSAKGTISRPLKDGRRGKSLKAKTRYHRLLQLKGCALLEVMIEQGRKHQIRRHLQGIGSGVVGDRRYPPHRRTPLRGAPDRLWLHASALTLPEGLTITAPLPSELRAHMESIVEPEELSSLHTALSGLT